eukprot:348285-Hanusia_phi.AAC.7
MGARKIFATVGSAQKVKREGGGGGQGVEMGDRRRGREKGEGRGGEVRGGSTDLRQAKEAKALGADHVVVYKEEDFETKVKEPSHVTTSDERSRSERSTGKTTVRGRGKRGEVASRVGVTTREDEVEE